MHKPKGSIWSRRNRPDTGLRLQRVLRNHPGGGNAPELGDSRFREPQRAIPARSDPKETAIGGGHGVFGDRSGSGDPPDLVDRPSWVTADSVNHSAPSRPAVIPKRPLLAVGTGYSVIAPAVVIRPIW